MAKTKRASCEEGGGVNVTRNQRGPLVVLTLKNGPLLAAHDTTRNHYMYHPPEPFPTALYPLTAPDLLRLSPAIVQNKKRFEKKSFTQGPWDVYAVGILVTRLHAYHALVLQSSILYYNYT